MTPPLWDQYAILELLCECGRVGLHYFRKNEWHLKQDGSLVTRADIEIEKLLTDTLERPASGIRIIGEETISSHDDQYIKKALSGTTWVVDPIDGTASYAHGLAYWGTSIGLMQNGKLVAGGLVLPAVGELFLTDGQHLYWVQDLDLNSRADQRCKLAPLEPQPQALSEGGMIALGQRFVKNSTFPFNNPIYASCCAINSISYLLLGRYMAYIGHMKLWDLAAGLPMLLASGFEAMLINGTPLTNQINDDCFQLDPKSPHRWALNNTCIFAPCGMGLLLIEKMEKKCQ